MTLIILLQALFATSFPLSKYLLGFTSPIFLSGLRMFIAGIILLSYQYWWPTAKFHFKRKHFFIFLQIIILGMYSNYALRLYSLQYLPIWKTSFFYNFAPFLSSLYAYILFREKMTYKQWVGLTIGLLGMIPILISSTPAEATVGEIFYISRYELFLLISVIFHSYSWILVQRLVRDKSYPPMMVNGIGMTCGGLLSLITSYFYEPVQLIQTTTFFGWLIAMIFVSNIMCHNIYAGLLKRYTATFMSFTSFLGPLFAALYGWALFNEHISWHFYVSGIIVFAGLYLFYQDELRRKRTLGD